jgi:hypothetical protein
VDKSITDSLAYAVKKITMGEDKIEIVQEIKHFSHQHDLKLVESFLSPTKNVMGVCILYSLRFTLVLNVDFFFINLVLNYQEKRDTHFTPTSSPSSQSHLMLIAVVMFVVVMIVMASLTIVRNANLMHMYNVV